MTQNLTRREVLRRSVTAGSLAAVSGQAQQSGIASSDVAPAEGGTLAKPLLSDSQLKFRIGLAKSRTRSYPLDSIDFIMMDLERPPGRSRHAHWCTGDLTGRLLEFLSCAEGIDGRADSRLPGIVARIMRQRRPSGLFGRYASQAERNIPPEEDPWSGSDRLISGLLRYYEHCQDATALEAAVGIANRFTGRKDEWSRALKDKANRIECWVTEPVARLYHVTKDRRYLEFNAMIEEAHPLCDQPAHAHAHLCTLRGLQLMARYTGDGAWNEKPERNRRAILERHFEMPDGGMPEVFPRSARNEGCAIGDWLMLNLNAGFLLDDDSAYEKAERIFWNALAFNQWITGAFGHRAITANGYGVEHLQEAWWCCLHHCGMAMTEYAKHAVTLKNNVLRVNLLAPGAYVVRDGGGAETHVRIATSYPTTADASIEVTGIRADGKVRVRIPGCVKQPSLDQTRNGDSVRVVLKGRLGHTIERLEPGGMLMYGPLILTPSSNYFGPPLANPQPSAAVPAGYVPESIPPGSPLLLAGGQAGTDGFLRLNRAPLPVWSYFEEGSGSPTWVDGAAVNVPVKLADGTNKELRFSPMCYNTSCLVLHATPIRMQI